MQNFSDREAAFNAAKKLRFQFDVRVRSIELVSALSMQHIWTVVQHDSPNHLELRLNQERDAVADPISVVLARGPKVSKSR